MDKARLLEEIYVKYSNKIYHMAFYYLNNSELSEDMVHEVMIKINNKIMNKTITSSHKLDSLIGYIVKGVCIDYIRHNSKVSYREIEDNELVSQPNIINTDKEVLEIINKLPEKHRTILIMRFVDDLSYKEISQALNVSEASARKKVERAKKKLKKIVEGGETSV